MHIVNTLLCLLLIIVNVNCEEKRFTLKQIVILSRHGLRTPLSKLLAEMTPRHWPSWKEKPGYLTAKGSVLEGFMGQYFSSWLMEEGLLLSRTCPSEETFYVYANTKQRTLVSATAFVNSAFPGCNITIHHSETDIDPIFNPVIHNTSLIFKQNVIEEMQARLKTLSLNSSFENLEDILNYKNSEICTLQHQCDLTTDKSKIYVMSGVKPNLSGPLKIGNSVMDAFIMQYYEGFSLNNVAWGNLKTDKDWLNLMNICRGYHNVIFNTSVLAEDIAKPLLKYMSGFFLKEAVPKVVLLMGHDANMYTILNSLNFKPYTLTNQYELTPVSGKIVFQKWFDEVDKKELLKINYVYQSPTQLRDGIALSLRNPPESELLELNDCEIDENGFCPWKVFTSILENLEE